jgi:hypothetical protein
MTELFVTVCKQLRSFWMSLIADRHATFLVRVMLSILHGDSVSSAPLRSNKSKVWSEKHNTAEVQCTQTSRRVVPSAIKEVRVCVIEEIMTELETKARSFAFDPVVNPVLQQLLDLVDQKEVLMAKMMMMNPDGMLCLTSNFPIVPLEEIAEI